MLKIKLNKKRAALILSAAAVLVFLALFIYLPLLKEVKRKSFQWNGLRDQLDSARMNLEALRKNGVSKKLILQSEVSSAINTITREGRNLSLDFKSISQKQIRSKNNYAILPLQMEMEGDYKLFGFFFAALENIKDVIVTVEDFQIRRNDKILPKISAVLTLNIHLAAG